MSADRTALAEARLAVTAASVTGDSGGLYHLVSRLMGDGVSFETILFDLLLPVEHDIGDRWQRGDYLVAEEHAATATVETVVALLAGAFDQPWDGVHVVVGAAEGDYHSLPARVVVAHLSSLGYRTTFLGANVLASDLGEFLASEPPAALVLSCAMANHLLGARAAIRAGHAVGVPVIVGGNAFGTTGERAGILGADAWVSSPREVPDVLNSWTPQPDAAEAAAVDPSEQLTALIGLRSSVAAAAQREMVSTGSGNGDPRLAAEISLLLGAVEASMLVGDDEVIAGMLRWQEATLTAHGYDTLALVATSLRSALEDASPPAGEALARAMTSR